jgi:hypothetical protein
LKEMWEPRQHPLSLTLSGFLVVLVVQLFTGPSAWEWTMSCTDSRWEYTMNNENSNRYMLTTMNIVTLSDSLQACRHTNIHTGSLRFDGFSHHWGPFSNPFPLVEQENSSSFCNVCHEKRSKQRLVQFVRWLAGTRYRKRTLLLPHLRKWIRKRERHGSGCSLDTTSATMTFFCSQYPNYGRSCVFLFLNPFP